MTKLQRAIIVTLRQEPQYKFIGGERQAALRMAAQGWLEATGANTFKITDSGEAVFNNQY